MPESGTRRTIGMLACIAVACMTFASTATARRQPEAPSWSPPNRQQLIEMQTRAAAHASRARVTWLEVRIPAIYSLTVQVRDPAAYLRYRANTLLLPVFALTQKSTFVSFRFALKNASGRVVFWFSEYLATSKAFVLPELADCASYVALDLEFCPDSCPPCPA